MLYKIIKILYICIKYTFKVITKINKKNMNTLPESVYHNLFKNFGDEIIKAANIQVEVEGLENLDSKEDSYIYISNHTSLLDIPILAANIPDFIRFIYKTELGRIPLFGTALRKMQFIQIDRNNPKNAFESIEKAADMVSNTGSVILFPEGSRSKTGKVGKFKRGAFILASKTKKKIVPIAICGMNDIMPAKSLKIKSGKIKIIILPIIDSISEERNEMQNQIDLIKQEISKKVDNF